MQAKFYVPSYIIDFLIMINFSKLLHSFSLLKIWATNMTEFAMVNDYFYRCLLYSFNRSNNAKSSNKLISAQIVNGNPTEPSGKRSPTNCNKYN